MSATIFANRKASFDPTHFSMRYGNDTGGARQHYINHNGWAGGDMMMLLEGAGQRSIVFKNDDAAGGVKFNMRLTPDRECASTILETIRCCEDWVTSHAKEATKDFFGNARARPLFNSQLTESETYGDGIKIRVDPVNTAIYTIISDGEPRLADSAWRVQATRIEDEAISVEAEAKAERDGGGLIFRDIVTQDGDEVRIEDVGNGVPKLKRSLGSVETLLRSRSSPLVWASVKAWASGGSKYGITMKASTICVQAESEGAGSYGGGEEAPGYADDDQFMP